MLDDSLISGKISPPINSSFSTVTSLLKTTEGVTVIALESAVSIKEVKIFPVMLVADTELALTVVALIVVEFRTPVPKVFELG
jgi:hypothetical protein